MKRAPPFLKQTPVSNFVRERVLEGVFEVGKQACLVNEFGRLKMAQFPSEIFFR